MHKNTIIIIPTYNEAENIGPLIKELFSLGIYVSVLVIDDNSPDGTYQLVKELQSRCANLYLIKRAKKLGLASAYIEGFNFALKEKFDAIIQMDADLSHPPDCIPRMLSLLDKYDLIIGSRYIKGGNVSDWPLSRVLLSRLANIFAKTMLSIPIKDSTSGFKCIKKDVLENIDFNAISCRGYVFQIEIVLRALSNGFKLAETPIIFEGRKKQKSKMSFAIIFEAFFYIFYLSFIRLLKFKKRKKVSTA